MRPLVKSDGGRFDPHAISRHDTNEVFAHPARDMRDHQVAAIKLDAKPRVRQRFVTTPSTSKASSLGFCVIRDSQRVG